MTPRGVLKEYFQITEWKKQIAEAGANHNTLFDGTPKEILADGSEAFEIFETKVAEGEVNVIDNLSTLLAESLKERQQMHEDFEEIDPFDLE